MAKVSRFASEGKTLSNNRCSGVYLLTSIRTGALLLFFLSAHSRKKGQRTVSPTFVIDPLNRCPSARVNSALLKNWRFRRLTVRRYRLRRDKHFSQFSGLSDRFFWSAGLSSLLPRGAQLSRANFPRGFRRRCAAQFRGEREFVKHGGERGNFHSPFSSITALVASNHDKFAGRGRKLHARRANERRNK